SPAFCTVCLCEPRWLTPTTARKSRMDPSEFSAAVASLLQTKPDTENKFTKTQLQNSSRRPTYDEAVLGGSPSSSSPLVRSSSSASSSSSTSASSATSRLLPLPLLLEADRAHRLFDHFLAKCETDLRRLAAQHGSNMHTAEMAIFVYDSNLK